MEDKNLDKIIKLIEYIKRRELTKKEKENTSKYIKSENMNDKEAREFFLKYLKKKREPYFDLKRGELRFHRYTKLERLKVLYIRYKIAKATKQILPIMRQACNWQNGTCVEMRNKNENCSCCNDGGLCCVYLSSEGCTLDPNSRPILCHSFICGSAVREFVYICLDTNNEQALKLYSKIRSFLSKKNYSLILKDWYNKSTGVIKQNKFFEV